MKHAFFFTTLAAALLASQAWAENPTETPLEASNRILKGVSERFANQARPTAPALNNLPRPSAVASPAELAKQFRPAPITKMAKNSHELMIFVSFSMPPESLQRIVRQSEKTGARILFRGFKGEKLSEMSKHVANLIGNHHVEASVNPPAFTQYKITQVPVLVIAQPNANEGMDNGCAQAARYIKVSGDVSQDYALDLIERQSPQWASAARSFNLRLGRGNQ
ncbi:MAG: type-F conjugative transfer system pilin assembly protein TrbC [Gallionella sp.]